MEFIPVPVGKGGVVVVVWSWGDTCDLKQDTCYHRIGDGEQQNLHHQHRWPDLQT